MNGYIVLCVLSCIFLGTSNGLDFESHFDENYGSWRHGLMNRVGNLWPFSRKSFPASRRADESEEIYNPLERDREPLDVEVISGPIGNPDDAHIDIETHQRPEIHNGGFAPDAGVLFHQQFSPFFGNPFFNTFGFGSFGTRNTPWWKGPNVCTERSEEIEEVVSNNSTNAPSQFSNFGIHFTVNSCVERAHKHICKTILNNNGRKKTLSVIHQCCQGYGRQRNADTYASCEKIDLKSIMETSKNLGAKEFISSAYNNGLEEKFMNVTLFLPTDESFTKFSEHMFESNLVVLPMVRRRRQNDDNGITTKDLALNHIVEDLINIEDIENEQLLNSEYNNLTIRMNVFPSPPNDPDYEYNFRYTANCAPLIKVNQFAENGIIHVIDRVLTPVTQNLMEIIRGRSDMSVLQTVLEKTNLAELLESGSKQFTLFAPDDSAFEKLEPNLRRTIKDANGCALNILKNHILDMTFCSVAVVKNTKTGAINSLGLKMNLEYDERITPSAHENEVDKLFDSYNILINGEARILEADIMGTNGVVHVIDTVLPTESGLPFLTMLTRRNLTIFEKLIDAANVEKEFDTLTNVSYFVPTDKAFENTYWKQQLDEHPEELKNNNDLKSFIKYHIAKPLTKTCDLSETMMETEAANPLRVNLYSTHSVFNNVMNRATVNCARLVHFDDDSCGSVLHQVDRVLTAPTNNLLESLEMNENYSMFLKLVKTANLTNLLSDLGQSLTVLVPNNDIFQELKDLHEELLDHPRRLERFVKLHILDDVLCCAGIVHSDWPFVRLVKTINEYELRIARDRRPKIQNAGITKCDIIAKNGIILEVNDVINVNKQKPQEIPISSFLEF